MAYTDKQKTEIVNEICKRVSEGEALRNICSEKEQIDVVTFYKWIDDDEDKAKHYARGIRARTDIHFESIREIIHEDCTYTYKDENGNEITRIDSAKVQHQRLKMDGEKWMVGKENAPKYGDVTKHKISGDEDDDTPIKIIGTIIK